MKTLIKTLLIGGGGVRTISFIGVLKKLKELENDKNIIINIDTVIGVSAGSIFGLAYILGFTIEEMENEILYKNLDELKDIRYMNFLNSYGLDSGNKIIQWLHKLIEMKGYDKDITFNELFIKTKNLFSVFATNLTKYKLIEFNKENTPDMKIVDAIRMSISIPFMFTINKNNDGDVIVDGGLISSFPIFLYKDKLETLLGLKLVSNGENDSDEVYEEINSIENYIYHVLSCFSVQREKHITLNKKYKDHVIFVNTKHFTQTVNFGLQPIEKKKLIEIGYECATNFFKESVIRP